MKEVGISEFRAKSSALLREARATKKPIQVTRFGKPVAVVFPVVPVATRDTWIGSMKDSMEIRGDIVYTEPPLRKRRSGPRG